MFNGNCTSGFMHPFTLWINLLSVTFTIQASTRVDVYENVRELRVKWNKTLIETKSQTRQNLISYITYDILTCVRVCSCTSMCACLWERVCVCTPMCMCVCSCIPITIPLFKIYKHARCYLALPPWPKNTLSVFITTDLIRTIAESFGGDNSLQLLNV